MRKSLILTSILALAACSTGGGGGSNVGNNPRHAVTQGAIDSNKNITNMTSEILIPKGFTGDPVIRSGTIHEGGRTYTSYRLDDVKLFSAESANQYLNLKLDNSNGEINAVRMVLNGEDSGSIVREKDNTGAFTNAFAGPIFEYVADGEDQALFRVPDTGQNMAALNQLATKNHLSGGHWNRIDERMLFQTYGGDEGHELQYSDFGYFNPIYRSKNKNLTTDEQLAGARAGTLNRDPDLDKYRDEDEWNAILASKDYQLFAGGYAISGSNIIDSLPVPVPTAGTNTYSGKAMGRIYASIQSDGVDRSTYLAAWNVPYDFDSDDNGTMDSWSDNAGHDMAQAYTTSHATLTIDTDGNQVLFMPFNTQSDTADTFYDVTVTKPNGEDATFAFTGSPNEIEYRRNTTEGGIEQSFNPGYYGVNDAAEAAGTVRYYTEQDISTGTDTGVTREWEFQGAYGMKKD